MAAITHATAAGGSDSGDGKISKNAWNEGHTVDYAEAADIAAVAWAAAAGSSDEIPRADHVHANGLSYMLQAATADAALTPADTQVTATGATITPAAGTWLLLAWGVISTAGATNYAVAYIADGSNNLLSEGSASVSSASPVTIPVVPIVVVANGSTAYKVMGQMGTTTTPKILRFGPAGLAGTRILAIRLA